jgi:tetratricopeptide (TPR) repeat protein
MDQIMVLRTHTLHNILIILFIATYLNACSHLGSGSQNNSSPNKPVIPVDNKTVFFPSKPSSQNIHIEEPRKSSKNQNQNNFQILENKRTTKDIPTRKRLKPADVLGSITDSAKIAIEGQQWLRAQHHLEHALRIASKDAEVFYLYALVYEGLGIKEQMINMLKRARFLAKSKSEVYQLTEAKLANITP